jgi:hypothetical protein
MKKSLYLNDICYSLDRERDQFLHLRRLYTIKPTLKIEPPVTPKFLKNNKSKLLKRAQTQIKIDYENDILFRKILEINVKKGEYNKNIIKPKNDYPAFRRTYFNYKYQDIEKMKSVLEDNIYFYNRLNKVKSHYNTEDMNEEARKQEKYLNNILEKNKTVKVPPTLNYYDIDQYKNLVEAQNEKENEDENIIEEDEREGDEEEGEDNKNNEKKENNKNTVKKKENVNENKEENNGQDKKRSPNENKNKEKDEQKKNNISTTNNSTENKNNA